MPLPKGKGLWVNKLPKGDTDCFCPHVWWRFVFVSLSPEHRIRQIFTEVHEVYKGGHGEVVSTDLEGEDEKLASKELKQVVRHKNHADIPK